MPATVLTALIARCRSLGPRCPQSSDAELLRCFAQQRDAAAFAELLERYAPLVWSVCRRILPVEADCEDAFQATFLALVRQAGSLEANPPLGGWLHTVAVRVAHRVLDRSRRQRPAAVPPERLTSGDVADDLSSRELFRAVDEEIERLPATLRLPIILCCLEGRTRDEAAERMGCSVAAVKGRLERGRHLLRHRLERRGIQLPAAFLVLGLTSERLRAGLWAKTMQSILHAPSPAVAALSPTGLPAMAAGTSKLALVGLATLLMTAGAAGLLGQVLTEKPPQTPAAPPQAQAVAESKKPAAPRVRTDRHGDPLPDGAIARLGTVRWRHGFVDALAYSPNGKMIAAVGAGRAITLWDAATGKEIHQFPNDDQPQSLAFSPDGKILATAGAFMPVCHLWDVATGKELRQLKGHGTFPRCVAFSPDGKLMATASGDSTVRLWDTATGEERRRLDGPVGILAYSPDGKTIAWTGLGGVIHLWDPATGKEQRQLRGHNGTAWCVVFSPDGKRLASASEDETIRLWDPATGRQIRVLGTKLGVTIGPLAFSPDSTLLASGYHDCAICLWDAATGAEKRRWRAGALHMRALAFSPDGKTLASGAAWESIRLWDVATGRERHPSEEHRGPVHFLRFSPDGASLVSLGPEQRLLRWDLATQTPQHLFSWTASRGSVFALSPDGHTLAMGDQRTHELWLWDIRTDKPGRLLGKHRNGFAALAFSPDGRFVACGEEDRAIHVWDVRDGKEVRQFKGFPSKVMSLRFSPDSKELACGIWTRNKPSLRLWNMADGKEQCTFECLDSIGSLSFSPDGKVLATGDALRRDDSLVRLWDTISGKELCRHTGHRDDVGAIAFSPDGKLMASGANGVGYLDNSVHVWEAATGRLIRRFEGHHSCVGSVAFSPDGLTVASGAGDSTILLWDITGRRADGRWHAKQLTPRELEACWTSLMDEDAAKAYDAVWMLVASAEQAVPFLAKHLQPAPRPDVKILARLIADLDSEDFRKREKATEELSKLGGAAAPALQQALDGKPALEMRRRLQRLLDQSRDWTPERLRDHRAIQALEHINTPKVKEVLEMLAAGAGGAYRTEEAKAVLRRLAR